MNKTIAIKIPVDAINKGIEITAQSKNDQEAIDQERRSKYPIADLAEVKRNSGEAGAQLYIEYLEECKARKRMIVEKAQEGLKKAYSEAVAFIDAETTPSGEDIIGENAGDFALLEHNLVDTPDQLDRILEKHDNIAFRAAAQKYAQAHDWEGFGFFLHENAVRAYTEQIFNSLMIAAEYPDKPFFLQYVTMPHEYARIADAYGLSEVFWASDGEKLSKAIYRLWPEVNK